MARKSRARFLPGPVRRMAFGRDLDLLVRLQRLGRVEYGVGTYGAPRIEHFAYDQTRLLVGSYTSIGRRVTFVLGGNHPRDRVTSYPFRIRLGLPGAGSDGYPYSKGDIRVGSDVWIGHGALILSGVEIGHGAVVAARAVVTRSVPAYSIVAGNPARVVRYRHSESQREALLEIAWWEWPPAQVSKAVALLSSADIDSFIEWAARRGCA
jgi:acetyltransferase-like isoleucine patch superfamily enzyme